MGKTGLFPDPWIRLLPFDLMVRDEGGFPLIRGVYGYRNFCYRPYIKNGLLSGNCM